MTADLLDVNVAVEADAIVARLSGSIEGEGVQVLERALTDIHAKGHSKTTLDIRDLEFATSSALKVLANWLLDKAEQVPQGRVQFLSNPKHSWQRRSLQAIAAIVPDIVEVRTDA